MLTLHLWHPTAHAGSEYVKQSLPVPFVLIRPEAVRNVKLRLSTHDHGHGHSGFGSVNARREMSPERTEETPAMTGRRIAISYPTFAVGRGLMQVGAWGLTHR